MEEVMLYLAEDHSTRHAHSCEVCGRVWECFVPGGCREEREKDCSYCDGNYEEGEDE